MSKLKICIIGPGIVGGATGKAFAAKGFEVTFIGVDRGNIENLRKEGYSAYLTTELQNGDYPFDVSFLTVPTPTMGGQIDLSYIKKASVDLGKHLAHKTGYHLAVVKSTVLPGTTESVVIKNIEKYSGKRAGPDFGVCMNPEYLREKTAIEDALDPWVVVIGQYDRRSGDALSTLYEDFDTPLYRVSLREAEIQKYIHNLFNAAKITFFNEMRRLGSKLGLDMEKVFKLTIQSCEGIWNHRYGTADLGPFSGSCLPKDTQAFFEWALEGGWELDLLKAVIEVNSRLAKEETRHKQTQEASMSAALPL